jgi:hypothetical protein
MSSSKMLIMGVAAAILLILSVCWYAGYFSGDKNADAKDLTNLSDKKIGTLEMDKAFDVMKAFKSDFDENIFKELTHSLKSFTSASDETLQKLVDSLTFASTDEEQKKKDIADRTKKIKDNIKKINDEYFGATDKYDAYIRRLYDFNFEKKGDKYGVIVDSDDVDLVKKHDAFVAANVTDNPSKLSEEAKKALTEEKYVLTNDKKISSMKIMGIGFIKFVLE